MKKLTALLLSAVLALSLTGCGSLSSIVNGLNNGGNASPSPSASADTDTGYAEDGYAEDADAEGEYAEESGLADETDTENEEE